MHPCPPCWRVLTLLRSRVGLNVNLFLNSRCLSHKLELEFQMKTLLVNNLFVMLRYKSSTDFGVI